MRLYHEDTICAIITPLGTSSIGAIRVSGRDSLPIVSSLFHSFSHQKNVESHKLYYGIISSKEKSIDDCTAIYMKDPRSYTKEDCVELFLHGNPIILQDALSLLIKQGARLAEPGEFTKRAFLNGRFDLPQAESIAEIISAKSKAYLEIVQEQGRGVLSTYIENVVEKVLSCLAVIEANIEFPEDEIDPVYAKKARSEVAKIIKDLEKLTDDFESTRFLKEGISVALVGKVNVGKSTLMNTLLKKDRSIITDIPGTTRDIVTDMISINGINFILNDTAGLRVTHDAVEKIGLQKTYECIDSSDLVLFITDATTEFDKEQEELYTYIQKKRPCIGVLNKIDQAKGREHKDFLKISAKDGFGIEELKNNFSLYAQKLIPRHTDMLVINLRQKSLIEDAKTNMERCASLIENNKELELSAFELKEALVKLEEIIGKKYSDDLLSTIFSKFCIGK